MCLTIAMASGCSFHPHNAMKDKERGRREKNFQEAVASGSMGLLREVKVNRMSHNDANLLSCPAFSITILPPPKKRHHPVNQKTSGQPPSRNVYMDCKENKSENSRGGCLTSRISSLSPGTKRKMLGYAADGSIPPLPPRQKRVKKVPKPISEEGKLCTKFACSAEPSGLLGDLKPGIMRQHTRTRSEIHALLSAVVGDLLQRGSLSAVNELCYDMQAKDKFSSKMLEPLPECSDLNRWIEETSDLPTDTALQESLDGNTGSPKVCDQTTSEKNSSFADSVDGRFDIGLRPSQDQNNPTERTSSFVPFQRNGLNACNQNVPPLTIGLQSDIPVAALRESIGHHQQSQLPMNMKQEHDISLISSRGGCKDEAFECKQEEFENDMREYPFDISSLSDIGGSLRFEDTILLQQQEPKSLMSDSGANVATCWLELLSLDVKGRLAALRRSKQRVEGVIDSELLDLDAPLLPVCASSPPNPNQHAYGQPLLDSWRKVFESMDRALTLEGQKLKSWLQQIHVMQGQCHRDMTSSSSPRPASFSEPTPLGAQDVQLVAIPIATASIMATASFASQL
ncbi:hypothetical protein KC19_VG299600 [Ceratodon purpureus]|uniref:Uncharacterized protein n=1 Tax=Ceratodon purpureus TaxID=3225 RepID=A0A8T0HVZ0_CERPU|nr:hypothetical protein KC19_VG299600 [Ceratodon purpureus]